MTSCDCFSGYFSCSFHRFLGYDVKSLTHEYVSFILDFILLMLLVLVWKPIALCLIYMELLLRIGLLTMSTTVHTILSMYPTSILQKLIIRPYIKFMTYCIGIAFLEQRPHEVVPRDAALRDLWECLTCVASLSLLMKFFSHKPNIEDLRKHKKLAKFSFVYRFFRHMI